MSHIEEGYYQLKAFEGVYPPIGFRKVYYDKNILIVTRYDTRKKAWVPHPNPGITQYTKLTPLEVILYVPQ